MNEGIQTRTIPSASQTATSTPNDSEVTTHVTSMAVWDVPFPVVLDTPFKIKVGVKCSNECNLAGSLVEIFDQTQSLVASGTSGDTPWQANAALYWTEVELHAPVTEASYNWTAKSSNPGSDAIHAPVAQTFSFATVKAPECVVTVQVTDKVKNQPIKNAQVILHPFSGFTDEQGIANIGVTKGEHKLWIPKIAKFDTFRTTVQVQDNITVKAELVIAQAPEP